MMHKCRFLQLMILVVTAAFANVAEVVGLGVTVQNGQFMHDGQPYYAVGVNYFDCLTRALGNPYEPSNSTSADAGFATLAAHNIPFVRFNGSGYRPSDWYAPANSYLTNKTAYFAAFDTMVASAERYGIGLVPVLFWNFATPPDLVGDHVGTGLGNPASNTHTLMRQYITDVVTRYKDSPAIWGWEMGNEYNLGKDFGAMPPSPGDWTGTPTTRTSEDALTSAENQTALEQFAAAVRAIDPNRFISNGNSIPRNCAYHLANFGTWTRDTLSQFNQVLASDNSAMNTTCVHLYDTDVAGRGSVATTYSQLLGRAQTVAQQQGKPLFLGEFGVDAGYGANQRAGLQAQLDAIAANHVQMSAMWVYDYVWQDGSWNITPTNDRGFMLDMVGDYNRQLGVVVPRPSTLPNYAFNGDRQNWTFSNASTTTTSDHLHVEWDASPGNRPQMSVPCYFQASDVPKLYIRAAYHLWQNGDIATLYWEGNDGANPYSDSQSYSFVINNDGQYHTYVLDLLAGNPHWTGEISGLRFDLAMYARRQRGHSVHFLCSRAVDGHFAGDRSARPIGLRLEEGGP